MRLTKQWLGKADLAESLLTTANVDFKMEFLYNEKLNQTTLVLNLVEAPNSPQSRSDFFHLSLADKS